MPGSRAGPSRLRDLLKPRAAAPSASRRRTGKGVRLAPCHRPFASRGSTLVKGLAALVLIVLGWLAVGALFETEEDRVAAQVFAARDALVEQRDEDFLAFFSDDVTYQGSKGHADLVVDLGRWRRAGVRKVFILGEPEIELVGDEATISLTVAVGSALVQGTAVRVRLRARKTGDRWRVSSFEWSRQS